MIKKKIAIVVSSPMTISAFLTHQISALSRKYDVTIIANFQGKQPDFNFPNNVVFVNIRIDRDIKIYADILALLSLLRHFFAIKYDAVHSFTPKAGLIAMLSAYFARIKYRTHTFTGQVWVTKTGFSRMFLKQLDSLVGRLSTFSLVDSNSQRDFLIKNNVISTEKSCVLADGSISGVDVKRFHPDNRVSLHNRQKLNISDKSKVLLFIGRLKVEKGIWELILAFKEILKTIPDTELIIVGPDEENLRDKIISFLGSDSKYIHIIEYTSRPEEFMQTSDILCLPSYREG